MSTRDLLFEIGTEEIPARFMTWVCGELRTMAETELASARLSHGDVRVTGTPRRIVLTVKAVAERQEDFEEVVKGPPKTQSLDANGEYTKAALGFAKSRGVDVSALRFESIKGVEYLHATVHEAGRPTADILPDFLLSLMKKLTFPKSMYWTDTSVRFARPIRWFVALWDADVIDLEYCGIKSGRTSRGHRFMGARTVEIESAAKYESALERESVIVDLDRRKEMIREGIAKIEAELGITADDDPDLLEENAFLVEYPIPFAGSFEEEYLDIPEEVLIATMKKNQRYFPARNKSGKLAAHFIGVSNNRARDMSVVRTGNERVLRARLNDAEFFWREDQKTKLEARLPELEKILYQVKLGSLAQKSARVRGLAKSLAEALGMDGAARASVDRAALLAKADLTTGMVFEFPEVQGVMGREYAKIEGEAPEVCDALFEQYLPRSAGDDLPSGMAGAVIGICDRVDSIVGIHKVGLAPTGSADPYALRRAARCINEIVWGKHIDIDMEALFAKSAELLEADGPSVDAAKSFYRQRMYNQLRERGCSHGTALLAADRMWGRPMHALLMVEAFDAVHGESWFESLIQSAVRVNNILGTLSDADRAAISPSAIAPALPQEKKLDAELSAQEKAVAAAIEADDWKSVCRALSELSPAIAEFFESVMIMSKDPSERASRIALIARAKALFDSVGDFSLLKQ